MIENQMVKTKSRSDIFNLAICVAQTALSRMSPNCEINRKTCLKSPADFWMGSVSKEGGKSARCKESKALFSLVFGLHNH